MKKLTLTVCALAVSMFGATTFAQTHKAGEDMAAPSKPATAAEKDAARQKRRATSKEVVKKDEGRVDSSASGGMAKSTTAEEKAAARSKRQAAGKEAAKAGSGRLEDSPTAKP